MFLEYDHDFEDELLDKQEEWYEVFSTQRFDELVDNIEADMEYLIARRKSPGSTLEWRINLEQLNN